MKIIKYVALVFCLAISIQVFSQTKADDENSGSITTEWESVSLGKLQKKPRFKEPMIGVRFIYEEGIQYFNLSLKYMFTDAVFEEAVPVEYYKNERLELVTDKNKYELRAAKYAKARRMNTVAQKTADLKVVFGGDLSFLRDNTIKKFVVHFAQGYQNVELNSEEANHIREAYNKFLALLPANKPTVNQQPLRPVVKPAEEAPKPAEAPVKDSKASLEELRKRAKNWGK